MKIYGPYTRKDGRKHVIHYDGVTKHTQSYPRYLMEQHLGRKLESWEQVDHINNDPTDDRLENFQILTQLENIQKSAIKEKLYECMCVNCGKNMIIPYRQYKQNQITRGRAGPFCSKRCAGLYNR